MEGPRWTHAVHVRNYHLNIKSPHLSDTNKIVSIAEMMLHKRCCKKLYNAVKFDAHEGQVNDSTLSICFTICKMCSYLTYLSQLSKKLYPRQLSVAFWEDVCYQSFDFKIANATENSLGSCIVWNHSYIFVEW